MKYLLLIYSDESIWEKLERDPYLTESIELCHELDRKGLFISASPLRPTSTASTVRVRNGKTLTTSGPFAETHEQLGGYFLIDVENEEQARAIAAQIPAARLGSVEVRPLEDVSDRLPER